MIYAVDIKDPQGTHIAWLSKVKALAEPRTFQNISVEQLRLATAMLDRVADGLTGTRLI